jgi:hypothetical protein
MMDAYYLRQINLTCNQKTEIIAALLRFIALQPGSVPRDKPFFERFIAQGKSRTAGERAATDSWLAGHVARLFWVCCELGLLRYQYPYPHKGQTYRLTRAGQLLTRAPRWVVIAFVAVAYMMAVSAGPVRHFSRIRNVVTVLVGVLLWWRQSELSASVAALAVAAGIVSAWIAGFFSAMGDLDVD